ncbi:MAG: hypothetical protein JXQ96_02185 [Cyclobacteriaceae bacterium]
MKTLKKIMRLLGLAVLIALACAGVGAPVNFHTRDEVMDSSVKIVQEMLMDENEDGTKKKQAYIINQ